MWYSLFTPENMSRHLTFIVFSWHIEWSSASHDLSWKQIFVLAFPTTDFPYVYLIDIERSKQLAPTLKQIVLQAKANCSYFHWYKNKSRSKFFSCCYEILKSVSSNAGTPRWWFELSFLGSKPITCFGIVSLYFNPVLIVYPFLKKTDWFRDYINPSRHRIL